MPRDRSRDDDDDRDDDRGRGRRESGGSKKGFVYRRNRSSEDVSRRAKQASGRYDTYLTEDVTWFKTKEGENSVRLLPWLSGDNPDFKALDERWGNHWGIDIIVHSNVGADRGGYLCSEKMKNEPCAICEACRAEDLDELKAGTRVLCWLIDRSDERSGPKLWSMPLGVSKDFSAASIVKGSGETLLLDDPEEGYDIYFDREGEKLRTKYKRIEVARDPSPLHEKEATQDKWLGFVSEKCLPDLLKFYDNEYLEKVLSGKVSKRNDDDDDDADDKGDRRRGSRGRDDDDDDRSARSSRSRRDDDDKGDAKEEERGSRRTRRSRSDDDDADDRSSRRGRSEPEEEFTRPSRRARGADVEDPPPEEERPRGARRGRAEPEPEDDPPRSRARGRGKEKDPDDEPETPRGRGGKVERRRPKGEDDDIPFEKDAAGTDDDGDDEVAARKRLNKVGKRGR